MRTEETLNLASIGASLSGVVAGDTQSISTFPSRLLAVASSPAVESQPRDDHRGLVGGDQWKVDEHWTAVTGYLADLYLPNEG